MIGALYLKSERVAPRLRVGLMVDGDQVTAAAAAVIEHIEACDFAEIVLIVRQEGAQNRMERKRPFPARALRMLRNRAQRSRFAYAVYTTLDRWLARDPTIDPLRLVDTSISFQGIEILDVRPETKGFVQRFPEGIVEEIRKRDLDVLIRFGFNILHGSILTAARYGIWSYHHGDPEFYRGGPPQFWEMAERNPLSGAVLQVLDEQLDGGMVLEKGLFATDLSISLRRNRIQVFWGSAHFVIAKLKALHEHGFDHLVSRAVPPRPYAGKRPLYRTPTNREVMQWLAQTFWRKVSQRLRPRQLEHWMIAVRRAPGGDNGLAVNPQRRSADLSDFEFLPSPHGRVYADPYVFWRGERAFLFFENDSYGSDPAVISVAEIRQNGIAPAQVCLSTGQHLSFPQVFEWEGEIFMLPESIESGELALYRAVDFPLQWEKAHVLRRGNMVDAALWHEDGIWYLFATLVDLLSRATSLHLFTAESLEGPWVPHPENPLSNDVRSARGAGALFRRDGRLFRPSQDGSVTYGRALEFHEVDVMTPTAYSEHRVLTITPDDVPALDGAPATGIHTYHEARGIEVVDAKFLVPARQVM
ncbi:hypothetical protein GCM10007301_35760 [Azorhizobium oxalatiphilum]|uniref:Glucosamine inositolphosphorylceramide transferase 1 N-terminal domain-containing protein n=1 Tax=Azorhizobium oxalatiphilum TaxID=980631 RepID=A0A917FE58_9HYPH|nr:hypothetical protein [Azorhizobium oxalatiphilum]GGF72769.1 hypothetical protein GCM10007301_35760 [Azorhizobium oxalatiphilum]